MMRTVRLLEKSCLAASQPMPFGRVMAKGSRTVYHDELSPGISIRIDAILCVGCVVVVVVLVRLAVGGKEGWVDRCGNEFGEPIQCFGVQCFFLGLVRDGRATNFEDYYVLYTSAAKVRCLFASTKSLGIAM